MSNAPRISDSISTSRALGKTTATCSPCEIDEFTNSTMSLNYTIDPNSFMNTFKERQKSHQKSSKDLQKSLHVSFTWMCSS